LLKEECTKMAKKFGLNKGLGALLGTDLDDVAIMEPVKKAVKPAKKIAKQPISKQEDVVENIVNTLSMLDVASLKPGKYQPRKDIQEEELKNLADSIKSQGVLQPIVARLVNGAYEIVAGERRWRAAKLAGFTAVPVIVKDLTNEQAMAVGLIENIQREDLNSIEEALALDRLAKEFSLTHAEVAEMVGKSRSSVSNLLRLLVLPKDVQLLIERNDLDAGHAKVLLSLIGSELQSAVAKQIVARELSVRETEQLVARTKTAEDLNKIKAKDHYLDPDVRRLQTSLAEKIGNVVKIVHGKAGSGKIVIKYSSLDELDGILAHIQ
jgi:ParB family transcriptional regulator, chromosome partitioning protein